MARSLSSRRPYITLGTPVRTPIRTPVPGWISLLAGAAIVIGGGGGGGFLLGLLIYGAFQ